MKRSTQLAAYAALILSALSTQADSFETGMTEMIIADPDGDRPLNGFLWYPTNEKSGQIMALGNAVWEPISVAPDAPPVAGQHPLVVLSHGLFGNTRNQAWLAQALVQHGYVVAAIDHPGTSTHQRDAKDQRALWERPTDISRTIDHILAMDSFDQMIDRDAIFMAGHSLGGFTAVLLAGGRYDAEQFDATCETLADDLSCTVFASLGVARTDADRLRMAADWSDTRISGFAVLDPGGTASFSPESLMRIESPMLVIGAPVNDAGLDLDREARALFAALPPERAEYLEPPTLAHFDFLGVCTEIALSILEEEEPDDKVVCQDGREARRADHARIAEAVIGFFDAIAAD